MPILSELEQVTLPPESVPVGSIESVLDQEANQWQEGNGIRPSRS
jgi:hypothetical protein